MRAAEARRDDRLDRPLSPVLRARQGARGPRRIRRFLRILRARQRAQASREPVPAGEPSSPIPGCRSRCVPGRSSPASGWRRADAPIRSSSWGCPRSGSTLIEQILASHSQVEGTHELADVPRMVVELQGRDWQLDNPRYPAVLARACTAEDFRRLGEKISARHPRLPQRQGRTSSTRCRTTSGTSACIHLMLPNARIIDARREPMACCFGNFKQLFAQRPGIHL